MSATFSLSSGDPAADRRVDFALMLFGQGDHPEAIEVLNTVLERMPGWALGWYQLGEFHDSAGDKASAVKAWHTSLDLDPADHSGARLKLTLCGVNCDGPASPSAFVEMLFDQYAPKFDHALVDRLGYRAPVVLEAALRAAGRDRFGLALDLGCGTGLMGERLRRMCDRLEGVDISSEMLRQARAKGIYDRLEKADLQGFSLVGARPDLITAADVFNYFGALDGMFSTVSTLLAPGGLFALSVERPGEGDGFVLQQSRRYAHSEAYVLRILEECGLAPLSIRTERIRDDRQAPVDGILVVAQHA